ncbi:MAG TPA: bifunctional hydroxymethylpyrimidine kinase/phosphomethylpyrimidine kinase, partial [Coxiellaceae bacterium]|nr:bifunctional hydroxymethylpyrimidine kinase/phosphomethylpyrimidine kinase [Coxiellaceae bacterium]
MKSYIKTLTIAGSDSGGGAGIQADLKTFAALGCYGMSVITALTAQNTLGVQGVFPIPPEFVALQLLSVLDDMRADAVKTGMLHSAAVIEAIADELKKYLPLSLVVDPVMVAKDGSLLLEPSAIHSLQEKLFPLATLITPNLVEAESLLNYKITTKELMEQAAQDLSQWGSQAVLLKGGHREGHEGDDCLYLAEQKKWYWYSNPVVKTKNTHGTGCTLSAAIA